MPAPRVIIVVEDAEALAQAAAARIVARIADADQHAAICLTGGSTPKRLYELLATSPWRERIPWPRVRWFIGDDRFVPSSDSRSNSGMARAAFLDTCAAPGTVHLISTDVASPDLAAQAYQASLETCYGGTQLDPSRPLFDCVLMGIGPDGHTASLFPDDAATHEATRWVVSVPQAHVAPFVPRVTLTFPALASCREMLFMVSGADKRGIVSRVLRESSLPAARARSQEETVWLLDRAAAPEAVHG